jgi:phosphopantothenoylcysteine synthetase/decarboxylase
MQGRNVLLGVTAGIAAYKTPDLVRQLVKAGANVQVLMTPYAHHLKPGNGTTMWPLVTGQTVT